MRLHGIPPAAKKARVAYLPQTDGLSEENLASL